MRRFNFAFMITGLVVSSLIARDAVLEGGQGSAPEAIRSAVVPDDSKKTDVVMGAKAAAAPVPVPPLNHYAALWQRSMFTTLDLPAPEVPQGPGFADQLVLAGTYEVDGAVVAVILDKMTAQVSEARIGSDNEMGVRIKSVEPGSEGSVKRIQLQKGMQSDWIQVAEVTAAPAAGRPPGNLVPSGMANDAAMNNCPRGPLTPGDAPAAVVPASVVQPLPGPAPGNGGGAASPNPSLDDIPLPPD